MKKERLERCRNQCEKLAKRVAYFNTLEEGVDYKNVETDINAPLSVFKVVPLSEKGKKYFNGEI